MMIYILLGPPCSGKTTLGDGLARRLNVPHVIASALLKDLVGKSNEINDALQIEAIMSRLRRPDCSHGFVLDNFPRSVTQAEALDRALQYHFSSGVSHIFDLEVPTKILEFRAGARLTYRDTGLPFQNGEEFPDIDGNPDPFIDSNVSLTVPADIQQDMASHEQMLMRRSDDAPERFQHRLRRYADNIVALRSFYRAVPCTALDGSRSAAEVLAYACRGIDVPENRSEPNENVGSTETLSPDAHLLRANGEGYHLPVSCAEPAANLSFRREPLDTPLDTPFFPERANVERVANPVRRGEQGEQSEAARELLHEIEARISSAQTLLSAFSDDVRSKWATDVSTQPCGCMTTTKIYLGMDPPNLNTEELNEQLRLCRHKLLALRISHLRNEMGDLPLWCSLFFICCHFSSQIEHLQSLYDSAERRAFGLRNMLTTEMAKTAKRITSTQCAAHMPVLPTPGSP
eukprot:gnl/TRDRNA2_/TRDRNA2_185675_c0_seq1.p1 gnl/TRDRNA2_/TRDRNA2_185675_c0~~gnl/TRDRNA2_/TRDRNA2_185675_c0_seq1.p1  ORF type:complete len:460 (+),score=57.98 gnl/TRDRNA2_/TRDRNA2_185675_c0_seq1:48-1427(+)